MLVHGFGEDGTIWDKQVDALKDNYQFIVPDLPGSGKSEMIDDMSMEGMAEVLKTIINTETSAAIPVIGHSMGGYTTLALVEKYPESVSAFGLFHSSAFADSEEKKATRRKGIEFIKQHGAYEFLKTATPNLFSPNSKEKFPNSIEEIIEAGKNFKPEALIAYYEGMMQRPDRTHILKQTEVPVLFIMGQYDAAVPMEDTLKQCHLPARAHIHILQHSGHMGMIEEAEKTNAILESFLEAL